MAELPTSSKPQAGRRPASRLNYWPFRNARIAEPANTGRFTIFAALFLAILTLVVFYPALSAKFINYDDDLYVSANPHVQHGLVPDDVSWAWTSGYLGYRIPLVWMSYMLDTQLFGTNPWGYHLTNVLLHAANAVLLLLFLRRATGSIWRALLAAAIWAVHPLRVESVAWITERKDVLAGLFTLLTLYAYVRYAQKPSSGGFAAALVSYCLALLSKPPLAAAIPATIWLLDYWPLGRMQGGPEAAAPALDTLPRSEARRRNRKQPASTIAHRRQLTPWRLALEKWPFLLAALVAGILLIVGMHRAAVFIGDVPETWSQKGVNAIVAPLRSLDRVFWFKRLSVIYPLQPRWPAATVIGSAVFLLGVTGLLVWQRRRFPWLLVGWCWFAVNYAPALGLVQAGEKVAMGDRYTYIPSIGLLIMAVWSIPSGWTSSLFRREAITAVAFACIAALIVFTRRQLDFWQDSETLFTHCVAVTTNNWMAHNDLAVALADRGDEAAALQHFRTSIRINPAYPIAWADYTSLLNRMERWKEAEDAGRKAISLDPTSPLAWAVAKTAFESESRRLRLQGKSAEAANELVEYLKLDPSDVGMRNDLAVNLFKLGHKDEAIAQFQMALRYDPNSVDTANNLQRAMNQLAQSRPSTAP